MLIPQRFSEVAISVNGGIAAIWCEDLDIVGLSMSTGALSGHTVVFEVSNNADFNVDTNLPVPGTGNWYTAQAQRTSSATIETGATTLDATPAYGWVVPVSGWRFFRVRATAHTSGSALWVLFSARGANSTMSNTGSVTLNSLPAGSNNIGSVIVEGQGAEDAAAVGNAVRIGGRVRTAHSTTLVANDAADVQMTTAGQQLVKNGGLTESAWNANLSLTTTTAVALAAAGGASLKRHITGLQAINTGAATVDLIILDGATERWRMPLPVNVPVSIPFEATHLITTENTALNGNLSADGTVRVCAQGYTAP